MSDAYFTRLGFAVLQGPEIETDANNFDALNIPADHPAREGFDSFYFVSRSPCCARTHRRCRYVRCANPDRRSRSSCPAKRTGAMRSTRGTSTSSIKSEGLMVGTRHPLRSSQRRVDRVDARVVRTSIRPCVSARRSFRSPNPAPRSTRPVRVAKAAAKRGDGSMPHLRRLGLDRSRRFRVWCTRTCCAKSATIRKESPVGRSAAAFERFAMVRYEMNDIQATSLPKTLPRF